MEEEIKWRLVKVNKKKEKMKEVDFYASHTICSAILKSIE